MKLTVQLITPEIAKAYLEANTGNRNIRTTAVKSISGAMSRGEWVLTPQGISFDTNGIMIDGQHRLAAVIESGASVEMPVFTGVGPDAFKVMDRGIPRSLADSTKLPKRAAQILSLFHEVNRGAMGKPTSEQILALNEIFGDEISKLIHRAPTHQKGFSQVGSRAAVVILMKEGVDSALEIYRRLTLSDFSGAAPIVNSLVRQVVSGRFTKGVNGGAAQMESFCKTLFAFDPRNAEKIQLSFSDDMRKDAVARIAKFTKP